MWVEFCRGFIFATVAISLSVSSARVASAEANIAGTRDHVEVAANGASLEELFSAFRNKFNFSYRSKIPFDHKIDGSYSGSLASVVKRLLTTYDYVLKSENDELVVLVINRQSATATTNSATTSTSQARAAVGTGGGNPASGQSAQNSSPASNADSQVAAPLNSAASGASGSSVAAMMQAQTGAFLTPNSNVAPARPSQEAIAATLQRANTGLQALKAALARQSH
jgi:hypothetical protein